MCQVACVLGGVAVEMCVDSGAQTSIISEPLARQLGLLARLDSSQQGIAAGVGRARILGRLRNVAICIGDGVEFGIDFGVLQISEPLLLLGLDQLRRFKCIIDFEHDKLVFGGSGGIAVCA